MKDCNRALKAKIIEKYPTQTAFADAMGLSACSINLRINKRMAWRSDEIGKACKLLEIPPQEAYKYFF